MMEMVQKVEKVSRRNCPRETANLVSTVTFFYTFKLFLKSFKGDLEEEDIYKVYGKLDSEKLGRRLEKLCPKRSGETGLVSIIKILLQLFYRDLLLIIFVDTIYKLVLSNVTASAVGKLVDHFTPGSNTPIGKTYFYAGTIVMFKLFDTFFLPVFLLYYYEYPLKTKTAFSALIYKKILKLKQEDLSDHNTGRIVTLITKDVSYVHEFMTNCTNFFTETVADIVIIYNLHCTIGLTAYVGLGVLLSVVPFQLYLERLIRRIRLDLCKKSDHRLQITKETLSFIKVIKMNTWERTFAEKISKIRREEVVKLRHVFYLQGLIYTSGFLITQIALYVILNISASNKETSTEDIFYVVANFTFLELSFVKAFPTLAIFFAEMLAGIRRIFNLLDSEELPIQTPHQNNDRTLVDINKATVRIAGQIILNQISCTLSPGLNVITGHLGSGKTTLLKTILKEYPLSEGILQVEGSVSYAGQEPWLFPGTVKKNIVFGEEFDEGRYRQVLSVCALNYDLDLLTDGDQTVVEDNGSNLSKGQQARINLARAVYRESSIYLLDDCLSSVDVRVQEHIFQKCFRAFLKGKICVFVTQNPKHIKEAGQLIVLKGGMIISNEAPSKKYLEQLLPEQESTETVSDMNSSNEESKLISKSGETCDFNLYKEIKKIGKLDFSVYKRYIKFGGNTFLLFLTVFLILGDLVVGGYREKSLSNWVNFMTESVNLKHKNESNSTEYVKVSNLQNESFFTYSMTIYATVITTILKTLCFSYYMSKISVNIHKSMIKNVVTATMDFFDKTHLANILNRFSTDLSIVDEKLDTALMEFIKILGDICATFILIAMVNPMYLIPSVVITVLLLILRRLYMPTGRSLKRLENATCSPLVGHIITTLSGMTTIRAFNREKQMISEFNEYLNLNTSTLHMSLMTQFALGVYLNLLSFIYICYVLTDLLFFNVTQAGDVGLILNKSFKLSENLQSGIIWGALLENLLTAVERILEYTDVERENLTGREIDNWPGEGSLEYKRVSLNYPITKALTLKSVNFKIAPEEKIAITGRTGSGKSSLLSALFRLYRVDGDIIIDNEHLKTVSLNCLRSRISIIPQDSVLFSGTVRENIDPKSEFKDTNIWYVLEKVGLTRVVPHLGAEMKDGGLELTSSQKQLFSIARALLRKNRIVVLDEPTANLDPETDRLINDIIGTEFATCTVLNITHKLNSIVGYDKILVMEKGETTGFDTIPALMDNLESNFCKIMHLNLR